MYETKYKYKYKYKYARKHIYKFDSLNLPCPLDEDNRFDAFCPFDQDCSKRTSLVSFP